MLLTARKLTTLGLLSEAGGELGRLDLTKLWFLLAQECVSLPRTAKYDFVPYRRGPFSFTLYHDLSRLSDEGYIKIVDDAHLSLTKLGQSAASNVPPSTVLAVTDIISKYGSKSTDELINHVYRTFPFYTMNSAWKERQAVPRPRASSKVYTVGYEGLSLDALLNLLIEKGIERLIDVRANPVARRYGFHKTTLARSCPKLDIEYVHVPELGVSSSWREDLKQTADYTKVFQRYVSETLVVNKQWVSQVSSLILKGPSVLMCLELDRLTCHRSHLATEVSKLTSLEVEDIRDVQHSLFSH